MESLWIADNEIIVDILTWARSGAEPISTKGDASSKSELAIVKTAAKTDGKVFSQLFRQFEEALAKDSEPKFKDLFQRFGGAFKECRGKRVASTPHLDVLQVFGATEDELRHSRVLSWFLDADTEHEQGGLFTRVLLHLIAKDRIAELADIAGAEDYIVEREKHKRTDVSVYRRGQFVIFIENKVRHIERTDQVKDMVNELVRLAESQHIPIQYRFAVFLTDDRDRKPKTGPLGDVAGFQRHNLRSLSRIEVFAAFQEALGQRSASPLLKNLLSCYLHAIHQLCRL